MQGLLRRTYVSPPGRTLLTWCFRGRRGSFLREEKGALRTEEARFGFRVWGGFRKQPRPELTT